jgi:hypothetical protein
VIGLLQQQLEQCQEAHSLLTLDLQNKIKELVKDKTLHEDKIIY